MLQGQTKFVQTVKDLEEYCSDLTKKLRDPSLQIELKMNAKSQKFSAFFSNATNEQRVKMAFRMQKQIRLFLINYARDRFKKLCHPKIEPFGYIDQICDLWQNYQRFVYGLKFFGRDAENSFRGFYKISNKFDVILASQQNSDKEHKNYKNQVSHIPVMAVNQLKQFLENQKLLDDLIGNFVKIFCTFMKQQRQGINTPQEKINEVLGFFESVHLDYECDCIRRDEKIRIIKHSNASTPANRRSNADLFFEKTFTKHIFADCQSYYKNWVDTKGINTPAAEQIKEMLNFLDKEEIRAKFYIHDPKNEKKYIEIVQTSLLEYKLIERLKKSTGLKYFLSAYELEKPDMVQQINNFWKAYKRIYPKNNKSKQIILDTYKSYVEQQAYAVSAFCEKPTQFIEQSIKVNKKNIQIIKMLGGILEFDRIRFEIFENMLSMKYVDPKKAEKLKEYQGAKNWAVYVHNKIKKKYSKAQKYNETDSDLIKLFKISSFKSTLIEEHKKFLNQRLVEDIDMGLQANYSNALELQQKYLEELKKETSENDVKSIQGCIKDVKTSLELRGKLKSNPAMKKFNFFNQIIRKSGNFWTDGTKFEITPPNLLKECITTIRDQLKEQNLVFELQNGTSLFTAKIKNVEYKFELKNIYLIILLLIDEKPKKRMCFTDIARRQFRPLGESGGKAQIQLIRALVQLTEFKLLKCSRSFSEANPNIDNWSPSDQFYINEQFVPAKKLPIYRGFPLPDYLRKAFGQKMNVYNQDEKAYQKNRSERVKGQCVKLLKHAQTLNGGQGTITFEQLLKGQSRENNVDAKYLKQIIEALIHNDLCSRLEEKKNTYRYKS